MFWIKMFTRQNEQVSSTTYCSKIMEHYQNTMPQLIINAPYDSNFVTIPDFFISRWKTLAVVERLFWQMGTYFSGRCRCREVVVVGRFKKESYETGKRRMDFPAGQKKMAVVERWPLVKGRQYTLQSKKKLSC